MVARLLIIKEILFEVNDCTEKKTFLYNIREYSVRFSDDKIKTLIESKINLDIKILSFDSLLTAIKDSKKLLDLELLN